MTGASFTPEIQLELSAKPEFVRVARHTIGALARLHGVQDDLIEDIKLAVSEACTNAMARAGESGGAPVEVTAIAQADRLVVEVADQGPPPEHEVSGDPSELSTGELPFDRALSLPLIRGLVDEVTVAPRDGGGGIVRMVVSLG